MEKFLTGLGIILVAGFAVIGSVLFLMKINSGYLQGSVLDAVKNVVPQKSKEELIAEAYEKSGKIKALYMTADVANDQGAGATRLRNKIIGIAETTEINGLVIDVKEVCGPDYSEKNLKKLLDELHQKNIWAIARIVAFKDASQIEVHPEWYLKRQSPKATENQCARKNYLQVKSPDGKKPTAIFWRDNKGGYWIDPASQGAREYLIGFSEKMIDLGFDELQFDYLRFPSDGDVEKAEFPVWNGKTPKHEVMKSFFEYLHNNLKEYKPNIILSADLFGYAAIRAGDVGIGQRLDDMGNNFDYLSFMVYPSHYYNGLRLPADPIKNFPEINLSFKQARTHPDVVVERSLSMAREFLDSLISTSTLSNLPNATSTDQAVISNAAASKDHSYHVRLRPWLEDFFHEGDKLAGRPYGVEKVSLQIGAAERVEDNGWMLWNASNVYTEGALTPLLKNTK